MGQGLGGCRQMVSLDSPENPFPDRYRYLAYISMHMEDYEAAARYQSQAEEVAWDDRFDILSTEFCSLPRQGSANIAVPLPRSGWMPGGTA